MKRSNSDPSPSAPDSVGGCPVRVFEDQVPRRRSDRGVPLPGLGLGGLTLLIGLVAAALSAPESPRGASKSGAIRIHEARIESVAFSPDGRTAASASRDGALKVWSVGDRGALIAEARRASGISSVAFSPDGRSLVVGGLDGSVSLREAATGSERIVHRASLLSIRVVAFSPDGNSISSAGDDAILRTWDARTGREEVPMRDRSRGIHALYYSPDGATLISAGQDGYISFWDRNSRGLTGRVDAGIGRIWSVDVARDGRILAVGGSEGIAVLALTDGPPEILRRWPCPSSAVRLLPDGTTLASTSPEGVVEIRSLSASSPPRQLDRIPSRVKALAASPDGSFLVTGADDGVLRFLDPSGPRSIR